MHARKYYIFFKSALLMFGFTTSAALVAEDAPPPAKDPTQKEAIPTPTTDTQPYSNDYGCYTVEFPKAWAIEKTGDSGDIAAVSPAEHESDTLFENAAVWVEPVEDDMNLNSYFNETLILLDAHCKKFEVLEKGETAIDGTQALWFKAKVCRGGVSGEIMQYLMVREGRVYILEYTAEVGAFERFGPTFDAITKSFRFSCPPSNSSIAL